MNYLQKLEAGAPPMDSPLDPAATYWRNACQQLLKHGLPKPTARQAECLQIVKEVIEATGSPPTYREIGGIMKVGPSEVACFLAGLEERGYIDRIPGKSRAISIIEFPYN